MRSRRLLAAVAALLVLALAAGAAWADIKDKATEQNNKCRITVGNIKSKADECDDDMAASIGEMLSTALANEDKFIVLASQEEVAELADEIALGESGMVEEGRGAEAGLMEGADVLITGAVTAFEPEASGGGGLMSAAKKGLMGKVGVSGKTAVCAIDLKLVDIRTRRVVKAFNVEAKSTSWESDVAGAGWAEDLAMGGALGVFSNQPMEKAIRGVLAKAVDRVAKEMPKSYFRYQGQGQYTQEYGEGGSRAKAGGGEAGEEGAGGGGSGGGGTARAPRSAENMALYTKYDFVPGDQVVFYDDLAGEEVGEFPSRWELIGGVFEIASKGDSKWILCTDSGDLRPNLPDVAFPSAFTIEWDIYDNGENYRGHWYRIYLMQGGDEAVTFWLGDGQNTEIEIFGKKLASKQLEHRLGKGRHTMRIMATKSSIKAYVDKERVANVPKVDGLNVDGIKVNFDRYDDAGNPMLAGKFRFAAGGKSLREQLDQDGKIVTHGILFDSGSAVIKGESYKTLAQIGELLTGDAALKLSIEGHTDSDGADDANLTLSQQRAEAVKDYLVSTFQVAPDRLATKGLGETKPIDKNTTPEGKANNRRVELVKI